MIGWVMIAIGSLIGILFTCLWKRSEQASKKKLAFGLAAYFGFALYFLGIINQFEPVLSQIKATTITTLFAVPTIMFAIIFFYKQNNDPKA